MIARFLVYYLNYPMFVASPIFILSASFIIGLPETFGRKLIEEVEENCVDKNENLLA
jgi:hypothetical protein